VIDVMAYQHVMSLLPLDPLLPGALPPDRRAALELRMAQLRTAPPIHSDGASRHDHFVTLSPVSTEAGEGQRWTQVDWSGQLGVKPTLMTPVSEPRLEWNWT